MNNIPNSVKNCSMEDALALSYYLYQLSLDLKDLQAHEEVQFLYNALVTRFGLGEHVDDIQKIIINKLIKNRKLTVMGQKEYYNHPFDYKGKLKVNYKEDCCIYDDCGRWSSKNLRDINMCRIIFSCIENQSYFSKIINYTFFTKPGSLAGKEKLPSKVSIPVDVKNALNNLSSVQFVIDCLKLTSEEGILLNTINRLQSIKEMNSVFHEVLRDDNSSRTEVYSKCSGLSTRTIHLLLKSDQKLRSYGFISKEDEMDEAAIDCIADKDIKVYFSDIIKNEKNSKTFSLDTFSVEKKNYELVLKLLRSEGSCNILLYGAPGSGKTEFAKALIKESGLKMISYKNEIEIKAKDTDGDEKGLSRLNCYLSLKKEDSILMVDEAETVLKTTGYSLFGGSYSLPQKGTVNKMIESSENKVIWILNYTNELDESTLRRFTYSIKFDAMPKEILKSIADGKISKIKMSEHLKSEILDLFMKYHVTGASVDNIVKVIKTMDCTVENEESILQDVKNVLEANSKLIFGSKKIRDNVKPDYNLSVLNTTIPAAEIVEMVENAVAFSETDKNSENGIRMLFYGLSGTGKTELARYIADRLGKKLLLKRSSDIFDKYVGGTEQNIRDAFAEAETTDSVLLFDEADSFFSDRENATYSWERTQVNEFLTQMEEFSGILICTTNLRKIMDPAMERRFHILSEFKPLNKIGVNELLKSYFAEYQFENEAVISLAATDSVTPGDFGTLKGKIRFMSKSKISSDFIISSLLNIQKEKQISKGRTIGFGA